MNAPNTMEEVEKVILECRANDFNKADILALEWSYEVNELAKELAKKNEVELKLVQIPSGNEVILKIQPIAELASKVKD